MREERHASGPSRLGVDGHETHGGNGGPELAYDRVVGVWSLDTAEGRVQCVRSVVNPEKLRHLGPVSDLLTLPIRRRRQGTS